MTRIRRFFHFSRVARLIFLAALPTVLATCDLVKSPTEISGQVDVNFSSPFTLVVAREFVPPVQVMQSGVAVAEPRIQFVSSDPNIVEVVGNTLRPRNRGIVKLKVRLLGSTLGRDPPEDSLDVQVIAKAVEAQPSALTVRSLNDTITLVARAVDDSNRTIAAPLRWTSSNPAVATVDSTKGLLTSLTNGATEIVVEVDGRKDTIAVSVSQLLTRFTFPSDRVDFASLGDTVTIVATPRDAIGTVILPAAAPTVNWTSSLASAASVSPTGRVQALANGSTFIIARAGTVADTVTVNVSQIAKLVVVTGPESIGIEAIGDEVQLTAIASDQRGATIGSSFKPTNWDSRDVNVATVENGLVRALTVGQTWIVASLDDGSDSVAVVVTNFARELRITPDTVRITAVGDASTLTATPRNRLGAPLPTVLVTWSAPDPSIVTVDAAGLATAQGIGTGRIVATAQAGALLLADTALVLVVNSPESVDIIPTALTLASVNDTVSPAATILNSRSAPLGRNAVTWTSDDPGIATVSTVGLIRALSAGETKVRATNPLNAGRTDSITVTVTNAPVSLTLNRPLPPRTADTLTAPGKTLAYQAVVRNARGDAIPGASLAWTTTSGAVATVNDGLATAVGIGTTSIIAEVGSGAGLRADTATLVVRNVPASLAASPTSVSLASVGATQQLTATALNDLGNVIPGLTFGWSSANGGVADVSAAGLVSAIAVGNTSITVSTKASTGAVITATVPVNVANPPTSVDITDANFTLASLGDTRTLGFAFSNATNPSLPATAVTWSTTNSNVATVSGSGVVTAIGVGTATIRAESPGNAAVFDQVIVTVTNAPATLTIAPAGTTTLTSIGAIINFVATVRNAAGAVIASPSPAVTWSDGGSAAVDISSSTGVATATANGSATITATTGAATLTATVNVGQTASAATSTVNAGASSLTANGAASTLITVQLKDALGTNMVTGPVTVTMALFGTGTLTGVTNNGNGTYTATLTAPTSLGAGTVAASIGGTSITSGNATVSYIAALATKYLVNSSSTTPTAGTQVTISAQLADEQNNPVTTAGKTVTWTSSAGGSFGAPTSVTNASGVATVTFTTSVTASTTHTVTATDNTALTGTSGAILTLGGLANNYLVTPSTTSPAAGSGITVSAQLRDNNNNPLSVAGQGVTWTKSIANGSFTPGDASSGTTTTNASGVATITLNTQALGLTATQVTATTIASGASGVSSTITTVPGAASAATTTISAVSPVTAGGTSAITVTAKDANSNLLTASGGTVTLATNLGSLGAVTDNGNGTYSATLTTAAAGTATISGTIGGAAITSNPTVTVNVAAASGATTTITASPLSIAANGVATSTISVAVKDALGNARGAGENVQVVTTLGTITAGALVHSGGGVYTATLTVGTVAGTATITGTLNAGVLAITDDATVTLTSGGATVGNSTITLSPVSGSSVTVGTPVTVTVQLQDANNNPTTSGSAVVIGRTGVGSVTGTTNLGGGAYTATLTSTANGGTTISATLGGTQITGGAGAGSPTITWLASAATQIAAQAGTGQSATAGSAVAIAPAVLVRDANSNPVPGVDVTFAVTGGGGTISPAGPATVTTDGAGIAALSSWTLGGTPGANTLQATVAALALSGEPVTFTATGTVGGASLTTSSITSNQASRAAGQQATITVQLKDANSNNLATSGGTVALATDIGSLGTVTNNNNGTYTATFTASTAGTATITGTLNGASFTDTEAITVTAGAASAATTTITASPTSVAANGVATSTITVQAKDGQGNNRTVETDAVVLTATPGGALTVSAGGAGTGTYTATLPASTTAEVVTITGTINAVAITDDATVTRPAGTATTGNSTVTLSPVNGSSVTVGSPVTVTVQLQDANNNATTSGLAVVIGRTGVGSITGTTNLGGGAYTATLTSTASGLSTVSATLNGVAITGGPGAGSPTITWQPGAATQFAVQAGDGQSATAGSAVAVAPAVVVRDANGNPVPGVNIVFTPTDGTVVPASAATTGINTNSSGIAALTTWTLKALAGSNALTATVNGGPLSGSFVTFTATGTVSAASLTTSTIVSDQATRTSGQTATITVQLKDANSNNLTTSGGTVAVATNLGTLGAVTNNNNGTYTATFTATTTGTATISGTLNGASFTDTEAITVTAGAADPATTTITALPISIAANGVGTSTISVAVKDAFGNARGAGETVNLATTLGNLTANPATHTSGGVYTATLTAGIVTGTATITGTLNAAAITDDATVTLTAGLATTGNSTITLSPVSGSNVTVGTAVTVTVQLQDANNNPTTSGLAVVIGRTGVGSVTGTTNLGGGTYTATLTSTASGGVTITATLGGAGITGSGTPTITFVAGTATQIAVNAGNAQSATAGSAVVVAPAVIVRDVNGNPVSGVDVTFTVTGGAGTISPVGPAIVTTDGAGIAGLTSWTLGATAGANTLQATVAALALTGEPVTFTATGTVGAASLTTSTIVSVPTSRLAGEQATITVQLKDANSNNLTTSGGTVALATNIGTLGGVTNNNNGTYTATFTATTVGTATVSGTLNGASFTDDAQITVTPGAASAATTTITASPTSVAADGAATSTITVQAKDAQGNNLTTEADLVTLTASPGGALTVSAGVAGSGTYTATLPVSTTAGLVTITGTINTVVITDDATVTRTAGAATTAQSTITLSPANGSSVTVGSPVTVTVQLNDLNGNNTTSGLAVVIGRTGVGSITGTTNLGSGTYVATLTSTASGLSTVSATLNSVAITGGAGAGSPTITWLAGTATQIAVNAGNAQSATAGSAVATAPSVIVRDANSNPVSGIDVVFTVTGGGGSTSPASPATVTTDGSGIAALTSWTLGATAGANTLEATVAALVLSGEPVAFTATGTVGAASLATSTIVSDQASRLAGEQATITVQLKDANSNNLATSGGTVALATNIGSLSAVTNNNNGTYTATFTATTVGTATISGTLNGAGFTDDAQITVTAGAADPATTTITALPTSIAANGSATSTISVAVTDAFGNARGAGETVNLATTEGSLSANPATHSGGAVYTATLTAGIVTGTATITGTLNAVAITDNATVTLTAGAATHYLVTPASLSVVAGTTVLVTAQLRDANNNPVSQSGKTVVWTKTCSGVCAGGATGGSFATPSSITDANGQAVVALTVSTDASISHTVTATDNTALTGTSASIDVVAGSAQNLIANSTQSQSAEVATLVGTPPSVLVRDQYNNPVAAGYDVVFTLTSTGGTGGAISPASPATVATNSSGIATLTSWTLGQTAGTSNNTVQASGSTALTGAPVTFNASGTAGALDNFLLVLATPQTSGVPFTGTNTLTARDAFNNTVTTFDASANNVTVVANPPLLGTVTGLGSLPTNVLDRATDFVSGVANLSGGAPPNAITYTGNTNTSSFTATSANAPAKTGTSNSVVVP